MFDEWTKEGLAIEVDGGIGSPRVIEALSHLVSESAVLRFTCVPTTSGSVASGAATDLPPLRVVSGSKSTSSKRLPPSRNELSAIANTGSLTRYIGPHRPQHEMQFQAEDPSIIYRVADAPSRHLLREVLPLGIGPSKKGR